MWLISNIFQICKNIFVKLICVLHLSKPDGEEDDEEDWYDDQV